MIRFFIIHLCLFFCFSCSHSPKPIVVKEVEYVVISPPKDMLKVAKLPKVPDKETATEYEISQYLVKLHYAVTSCIKTLAELNVWIEENKNNLIGEGKDVSKN